MRLYDLYDSIVEKEMQKTQIDALRKVQSVTSHPKEISKILAYAWFDSIDDAIKLADDLDLSKIDFLAINEDLQGYCEEWLRFEELKIAENF